MAVTSNSKSLAVGLLWTAPWWLGFLFFLAGPMAVSLYVSFCDYSLLQPPAPVGLSNYTALAADATFWQVIFNTLKFAAVSIPLGTALALLLAILLNGKVPGRAFFRACIFVPTVVPLVAAGVVWLWMFNPEFGLINRGLHWVAPLFDGANSLLEASSGRRAGWLTDLAAGPRWLSQPGWAMTAVAFVSLWGVGTQVVIYLAGLQEVPLELYEAARIDGATRRRQFWHITLPGLSPVILFNVIVALVAAWQIFALPYVLLRGEPGPERATYFYTMYLFDNAFRYLKMGYASAMAWIQLLIILSLTVLVFAAGRRTVHYRGGGT